MALRTGHATPRRVAVFSAWAAASAVSAACSLFLSNPDLEGDSADATIDPSDATTSDAPEDVAVPLDGPLLVDAGPDARFCERLAIAPTFCDDFDRGLPLGAGWDRSNVSRGALSLTTADSKSTPTSVQARFFEDAGGTIAAYLSKSFTRGKGRITVDLDVKAEASASGQKFFGIGFATGYVVSFKMSPQIEEQVPLGGGAFDYTSKGALAGPTLGAWSHYQFWMEIPEDGGVGTVHAEIDGKVVMPDMQLDPRSPPHYASAFFVNVGITYASGALPSSNLIDNVVVRVSP